MCIQCLQSAALMMTCTNTCAHDTSLRGSRLGCGAVGWGCNGAHYRATAWEGGSVQGPLKFFTCIETNIGSQNLVQAC
jgi:hypothetical protein